MKEEVYGGKGGRKHGEKPYSIAYQNKDITSKVMAEEFEGKSFAVYGINVPKIVKVEPTNLPEIEANELRMDNLFLLEDGSYAIIDYESDYNIENFHKYLGYVVRVARRLYNKFGRYPNIRMIIIYTADVDRENTTSKLDLGCIKFNITEAFLSELNNEKIIENAKQRISAGTELSSVDMMRLIVFPLTFRKLAEKQDAVKQVIQLVNSIKSDRQRTFILKCLIVFTDKIIRDEDAKQIKEVLMLTKVERLIYNDAAIKIAKNMIKRGTELEIIAADTDLPMETVVELYNEITAEKEQ